MWAPFMVKHMTLNIWSIDLHCNRNLSNIKYLKYLILLLLLVELTQVSQIHHVGFVVTL